jgi:hypothetical protein
MLRLAIVSRWKRVTGLGRRQATEDQGKTEGENSQ